MFKDLNQLSLFPFFVQPPCDHSWTIVSMAYVPAGVVCMKCHDLLSQFIPQSPEEIGYLSADWAWKHVHGREYTTRQVNAMQYNIHLYHRKGPHKGDAYCYYGSILPFYSEATIEGMKAAFLDEIGFCKACDVHGCRCHVMVPVGPKKKRYRKNPEWEEKLCPVLFHDVFKPDWKIEDIC